jgi:hypothetical protein
MMDLKKLAEIAMFPTLETTRKAGKLQITFSDSPCRLLANGENAPKPTFNLNLAKQGINSSP